MERKVVKNAREIAYVLSEEYQKHSACGYNGPIPISRGWIRIIADISRLTRVMLNELKDSLSKYGLTIVGWNESLCLVKLSEVKHYESLIKCGSLVLNWRF
jgi:hypothetical protein